MYKEYRVTIGDNEYPYYYSDNSMSLFTQLTCDYDADVYFILYDDNLPIEMINLVKNIFENKKRCILIGIKCSESQKDLSTLNSIVEDIILHGATRKSILIAIGGGILGNIVGLAASLIYRGIQFIHVPTTIIAATDSVLSLKQAINSNKGKNMIGSFYAPKAIFTDYNFFISLPLRDISAGVVELVKNVLTIIPEDIETFNSLTKEDWYSSNYINKVIELSIKAKNLVLKNDKFENHDGLKLEYGHTTGHAVELLSKGKVNHGEGVAFGMLVAATISRELGNINDEMVQLHYELLNNIKSIERLAIIKDYSEDAILDFISHDNKKGYLRNKGNYYSYVLLKNLGECVKTGDYYLQQVKINMIKEAISKVFTTI